MEMTKFVSWEEGGLRLFERMKVLSGAGCSVGCGFACAADSWLIEARKSKPRAMPLWRADCRYHVGSSGWVSSRVGSGRRASEYTRTAVRHQGFHAASPRRSDRSLGGRMEKLR
jgi:hypothetical protein